MAKHVTQTLVSSHAGSLPKISHHNCVTAVMCSDSVGSSSTSSNNNFTWWEGDPHGPSRYRLIIWCISCGWTYSVPHLSARGRWRSFWRNSRHSTVFLRPPGVCLWSPAQIFKQVRGVLATTAVSSMLPYCWLSSVSVNTTSVIHRATGRIESTLVGTHPHSLSAISFASDDSFWAPYSLPTYQFWVWCMAACSALRYVPRKPVLQHFLWWVSWDWDWAQKLAGQQPGWPQTSFCQHQKHHWLGDQSCPQAKPTRGNQWWREHVHLGCIIKDTSHSSGPLPQHCWYSNLHNPLRTSATLQQQRKAGFCC